MAKTYLGFIIICALACSNYNCLSKNGRTDANPATDNAVVQIITPLLVSDTLRCACDEKKIVEIKKPTVVKMSHTLRKIYTFYIGKRELTGNNDGPEVEMFLRSVGLSKGYPWCAAFVHYCLTRAGIANTVNAYAPTGYNKENVIFFAHNFNQAPKYGDVVSFFFQQQHRIAHTGFFDKDLGNGIYESVEGNTGDNGAIGNIVRNGDGVYRKKRSFNATYAISSWIKK